MEVTPLEKLTVPSVGDEIAGKYRVEHVIGQGGMGAVLAARNTLTGKRVAIKWLLPEHTGSVIRARLLREAQLAASIDHQNVVDIYDVGEHEGGLFLVMEYLSGRPLSEVMIERGRFEPRELIPLLMPAMRGVHAAHLAGVIHRDLKPENIILSESDGQIVPKVVDFGVSKAVGVSAVPNASLTRTGALVGTPHYMALEQIDDSAAVDARTDVYAFGVLLYRGLTGTYPFDGSSVGQVILNIGTKQVQSMRLVRPDLSAELDAVVLRALARDLHARFNSLEELARALMPFATNSEQGAQTSWQGSWGPSPMSFQALGIRSAQGSTPIVGATMLPPDAAEPAPSKPRRRPLLIGAAVVLGSIAASVLLAQLGVLRFSAPSAPPAHEAASTRPELGAERAAPDLSVSATAREATPPHGAETPAVEPATDEVRERKTQPDSAPADAPTSPRLRTANALESPKGQPARSRQERALVTTPKSAPPARVPGKRTNGMSLDEF